jgi:hypothetical protein
MSSADQKKSSGDRPNAKVVGIKDVIKPDALTNISSKENEVSTSSEDDSVDASILKSIFDKDTDSLRLSRSNLNASKAKLDASKIVNFDDDDDDDYLSDEELKTSPED